MILGLILASRMTARLRCSQISPDPLNMEPRMEPWLCRDPAGIHRLPLKLELRDARGLLLATGVGGEALSREHGAQVRLVAPGRRGFEWVKWVVRVELHDGPDPGAPASTVWSSFTPEGRGAA